MLSLQNVTFLSPSGKKILDSVSLTVSRGEIVGLVGGSGSGKSTLFYAIFHRYFPHKGRIADGIISSDARVQPVIQDALSGFNPYVPMNRLLTEPLRIQGMNSREAWRKLEALLPGIHMEGEDLRKLPQEYSGGQLQRLAILRSLLANPGYLVMDEPVSGLDPLVRRDVLHFLLSSQKKLDLGILFISHELDVVSEICSRVYVLKDGKILEKGRFPGFPNPNSDPYTKELFNRDFS